MGASSKLHFHLTHPAPDPVAGEGVHGRQQQTAELPHRPRPDPVVGEGADAPRPEEETPCSRPHSPDRAARRSRRRRRR